MPAFRLVEIDQAGPKALGILVPPGRRTLVIMRPRTVEIDLLLARPTASGWSFWEIDPIEARLMTHRVCEALERFARSGHGKIDVMPQSTIPGWRIHVEVGPFLWAVCPRSSGKPYRAVAVALEAEARALANELSAVLRPPMHSEQEVYLNLGQFKEMS